MKKIWINRVYIAQNASRVVAAFYAFLGFVGLLVSFDEILPNSMQIWLKLLIGIGVLAVLWILCFIAVGIVVYNKKRFEIISLNNSHKVYLQYGDLFSKDVVCKPDLRRNIVIPVNRCFDVVVDNKLISEQSVHGVAFKKLYESRKYSEETLNDTIQSSLATRKSVEVKQSKKPRGNHKRYSLGTIVDLPGIENEHYLLWALSSFDSDLKAHTTMQEYALAVQILIEAFGSESQGFPVVLPVVGSSLSRTNKDEKDILAYLVQVIKMNKELLNSDIHIVVKSEKQKEIAITNYL